MLTKFDFGSEAVPYIESCLSKGKTLSKYIYRRQRIDQRKEIFAYLPPETTFEQRVRFLEGRVLNEPGSRLKTAELIAEFLGKGDDRYAVFEHSLASPGDPWLKKANVKFFSHKSETYLFLTSRDTDLDVIQNTLHHSGGYPSIGILTTQLANTQSIQDRQEVNESALENLAAQVQYIIVGAYDEETVLFWRKE